MSIRLQNDVEALAIRVAEQAAQIAALRAEVDEMNRLLQAMTRATTARGKAA